MKISNRHIGIIALIIANIVWGGAAPIFKWSMQEIPPFTLAFLRFFIAAIVIFPFTLPNIAIKRQDVPKIFLLALFGIFGNISLFFLGIKMTSSINSPIITSVAPIMLIIIALFYLHEKPRKKIIFGTILSLIGVIIIMFKPLFEPAHGDSLLGNFLLLLSTISFVIYTILLKKYDFKYSSLTLVFWTFLFGAFLFYPLFLTELPTFAINHLETKALIGILYGSLSASTLAYLCYDIGVNNLKANEVGIFFYLDPIVTVLMAIPLLSEIITPAYIIGSMIVFVGIFIAEGKIHIRPHNILSKTHN